MKAKHWVPLAVFGVLVAFLAAGLTRDSRTQQVPLIGLDYKDQRTDGLKLLARQGDPYRFSVADLDGRAGIDWGVYGVPETFVIDKQGIIRYKQVGPLTPEALQKTILPLIERLKRA